MVGERSVPDQVGLLFPACLVLRVAVGGLPAQGLGSGLVCLRHRRISSRKTGGPAGAGAPAPSNTAKLPVSSNQRQEVSPFVIVHVLHIAELETSPNW